MRLWGSDLQDFLSKMILSTTILSTMILSPAAALFSACCLF